MAEPGIKPIIFGSWLHIFKVICKGRILGYVPIFFFSFFLMNKEGVKIFLRVHINWPEGQLWYFKQEG